MSLPVTVTFDLPFTHLHRHAVLRVAQRPEYGFTVVQGDGTLFGVTLPFDAILAFAQRVVDEERVLLDAGCEWDPERDDYAAGDDHAWHGLATWSVGSGRHNLHLCDACAALPRFKRFRTRVPLRRKGQG